MPVVIDEYFEKQYNNRASVGDHLDFLNSWKSRSEYFRNNTQGVLGQAYGSSPRQVLDIFPLQNRGKAPVHIFIHGGYWQALDKDSFSFMGDTFNSKGECAFIISYDLCPTVAIDEIIEQIRQLVLWVRNNIHLYGGDSTQVKITGHSAGAHLLAMLLTINWSKYGLTGYPFQQLYALSGLYDLQPLVNTTVNQKLGLDRSNAFLYSPLFKALWKPSKDLILNLVVGDLESGEYQKQSSMLAGR